MRKLLLAFTVVAFISFDQIKQKEETNTAVYDPLHVLKEYTDMGWDLVGMLRLNNFVRKRINKSVEILCKGE